MRASTYPKRDIEDCKAWVSLMSADLPVPGTPSFFCWLIFFSASKIYVHFLGFINGVKQYVLLELKMY